MPESRLDELALKLADAVEFAQKSDTLKRDEQSAEVWCKIYPVLSDSKQGLAGVALARAEAQVLRLSCVYGLLDCSNIIKLDHLKAALAVWEYAEESAKFIFGGSTGDRLAEEILQYLKEGSKTQTEIYKHFNCNIPAKKIKHALETLSAQGKVNCEEIKPEKGRAKTLWNIKPT